MSALPAEDKLPLTVLTGFLGSGKTTLLNRLVRQPAFSDAVVIINEFGEIGIDHLLVSHAAERLHLLENGCICCTVRNDLVDTLHELQARRARGELSFGRVVVETTGLADPAPLLHTLMAVPAMQAQVQLQAVVATVDACNALRTLARHPEAVRQVAMADVVLLTKCDLVERGTLQRLRARLRALNPNAVLLDATQEEVAEACLAVSRMPEVPGPWPSAFWTFGPQALRWSDERLANPHVRGATPVTHGFVLEQPVAEQTFLHWLDLLAAMRGENLLRVKGLVHVRETPQQPLVVHGAQHVFHPPVRLPSWPTSDHRTRMIFIAQGIERDELERTFRKFVHAEFATSLETLPCIPSL